MHMFIYDGRKYFCSDDTSTVTTVSPNVYIIKSLLLGKMDRYWRQSLIVSLHIKCGILRVICERTDHLKCLEVHVFVAECLCDVSRF
jgi:hypothetical protein